jgi:hypothetical protein
LKIQSSIPYFSRDLAPFNYGNIEKNGSNIGSIFNARNMHACRGCLAKKKKKKKNKNKIKFYYKPKLLCFCLIWWWGYYIFLKYFPIGHLFHKSI